MPITRDAAECMARFRVRCPLSTCGKNFCTNPHCGAEPFHLGQTCQQHREYKEMKKCRYCFSKLTRPSPSMLPAFKEVCRSPECITRMENTCDKLLPCGHFCCGFRGELKCLPCLDPGCVKKKPDLTRSKTGDDNCTICLEGLSSAPCIMTKCGHIFHLHCLTKKFNYQWLTPRIEFGFLNCVDCQ